MTITESIELFTAINVAIIGLSHLIRPKIWVEFFIFLHAKKHVGNIFNAMISLGMGSFILSFHFIWRWPTILISSYGLLQVIKGFTYLVFPALGIASISKVNIENANKFRVVGAIMVIFSLWIFSHLFM